MERTAAEARVRRDDQPDRAPDPSDLLDRDGVGQRVEAGPALVLWDRDAQPAELADAGDDLDRKAPLTLVAVDDRGDLGEHEITDGVAQEHGFRGEGEVHSGRAYTGPASGAGRPRPVLAFR